MSQLKLKIELVRGVEGDSLYLDDTRICGNKPWGGGKVIQSWSVDVESIKRAIAAALTGSEGGGE